jgi:AmmeMemoRadiSam system protein B
MGDGHEIFDLTGTVVAIKKRFMLPRLLVFTVLATVPACSACGGPTEPIPAAQADRHVRRPVDEVGYTHTAEGIAEVVEFALGAEQHRFAENNQLRGVGPDDVFAAGISPHDDYQYAQQVYAHLYPHIRASHVLVIGVAHKARDFPEVEGKLVFDSFDAWHGPYGDVEISPLRADLLEALEPGGNAIVHDELQSIEHSVEGLIPWLQHFDRQVQIVSILIPYMSWERLAELADRTAAHLQRAMEQRGMILGRDVAILISSDSVHYGDEGWGGKDFADFGVDRQGYDRAVERDLNLVRDYLVDQVSRTKLEQLYRLLVQEDYHEYRITWCGRFSVPFGLAVLEALPTGTGKPHHDGVLLRYGTTLDPGRHDPGVEGLGVTAPASLRHWVGFVAIGYR